MIEPETLAVLAIILSIVAIFLALLMCLRPRPWAWELPSTGRLEASGLTTSQSYGA
jgi:hypothetical protein